jgi:F-type H+-transporting ATPase subunit delta
MRQLEAASRYGRSIFELAEEKGVSDVLVHELALVRDAMAKRPELLNLLQSPLVSRDEKRSLISGIFGSKSDSLAQDFLILLVEKRRIDLFPAIVDELTAMMNQKRGIEEVSVLTARALHPSIVQLLERALEKMTRKKIVLQLKTDPGILSGAQIRIGNRLIDGTIRTKLNILESHLRTVKVD